MDCQRRLPTAVADLAVNRAWNRRKPQQNPGPASTRLRASGEKLPTKEGRQMEFCQGGSPRGRREQLVARGGHLHPPPSQSRPSRLEQVPEQRATGRAPRWLRWDEIPVPLYLHACWVLGASGLDINSLANFSSGWACTVGKATPSLAGQAHERPCPAGRMREEDPVGFERPSLSPEEAFCACAGTRPRTG